MQTLIFVILGISLLIGIGLMTMGQQYGMLFILFTLSVSLYINHKRNKEKVWNLRLVMANRSSSSQQSDCQLKDEIMSMYHNGITDFYE